MSSSSSSAMLSRSQIVFVDRHAHGDGKPCVFQQTQAAYRAREASGPAGIVDFGTRAINGNLDVIQACAAFTDFQLLLTFFCDECAIAQDVVAHPVSNDAVD